MGDGIKTRLTGGLLRIDLTQQFLRAQVARTQMHKSTRIVLPEHYLHPALVLKEHTRANRDNWVSQVPAPALKQEAKHLRGKKGEIVSDSNKQRVVAMSTGIYK